MPIAICPVPEGSLFFCSAKRRNWPITDTLVGDSRGSFRGKADIRIRPRHGLTTP
jgi:hypothetical protein